MDKLVVKYEKKLEKVTSLWSGDDEKSKEYVAYAQGELDAVKAGGLDALKKYWKG